ncbi:MAG: hypothetical protein A3H93_09095 [Rhodocyclales bacterium RIFCSPLOWO2_02_FULL_63_24]|nr:MAG: hypothetical protein A3H93_09095 [Rhodocyclales bacterium RIFCSPLOWO2_02_FULL_63_24]
MTRRLWTPEEDARLIALRGAGKTQKWIAADLGRPESSIPSRLGKLAIRRRQPALLGNPAPACASGQRAHVKNGGLGERKWRKCLCCGHSFESAHSMNRLCSPCRRQSVGPYDL